MNNTATNASVKPVIKSKSKKRAAYGFVLDFPSTPFTIRGLHRQKRGSIKYITLYMRVKKALKDGDIAVSGKADPKRVRKGRKELLFVRSYAKTSVVAVTKASV